MRALLTLEQLNSYAGTELDAYTNAQKTIAINNTSRWFERMIGHEFYYSASATFSFRGSGVKRIEFYGFKAPFAGNPTLVADVDGNLLVETAYIDLFPSDGPPYEELHRRYGYFCSGQIVKITAPWGWQSIPEEVQYGAYLMVRKYLLDSSYSESIISGFSQAGDVKRVKIESTEVEFFGNSQSTDVVSSTLQYVDELIEKYRRHPGGKTI